LAETRQAGIQSGTAGVAACCGCGEFCRFSVLRDSYAPKLAEDFKTIDGKEYKNAKVSRAEPDGIVITFSGAFSGNTGSTPGASKTFQPNRAV
jgi:hypothetical protein